MAHGRSGRDSAAVDLEVKLDRRTFIEAAAAAIGCVIVIAPCAFARAVDELSR